MMDVLSVVNETKKQIEEVKKGIKKEKLELKTELHPQLGITELEGHTALI